MENQFEIYESEKGGEQPWRYRLRSSNGKIVSPPEGYPTTSNVLRGIDDMVAIAKSARVVVLHDDGTSEEIRPGYCFE